MKEEVEEEVLNMIKSDVKIARVWALMMSDIVPSRGLGMSDTSDTNYNWCGSSDRRLAYLGFKTGDVFCINKWWGLREK